MVCRVPEGRRTEPMSVQSWRRTLALILAVTALTALTPTPAPAPPAPPPPAQPATQPSSPTQPGPPLDTRALEESILRRIIKQENTLVQESTLVRAPDSVANPVPEVLFPRLRDSLKTLPPFFRDTDLNF